MNSYANYFGTLLKKKDRELRKELEMIDFTGKRSKQKVSKISKTYCTTVIYVTQQLTVDFSDILKFRKLCPKVSGFQFMQIVK